MLRHPISRNQESQQRMKPPGSATSPIVRRLLANCNKTRTNAPNPPEIGGTDAMLQGFVAVRGRPKVRPIPSPRTPARKESARGTQGEAASESSPSITCGADQKPAAHPEPEQLTPLARRKPDTPATASWQKRRGPPRTPSITHPPRRHCLKDIRRRTRTPQPQRLSGPCFIRCFDTLFHEIRSRSNG